MTRAYPAGALLAALLLSPLAAAEPLFQDVTEAAGITFEHHSAPEKKYILESMSGGLALLDYNRDGLLDIYFVNSLTVDTADQPQTAPSALYENLGDGTFRDVAVAAGVAYPGWGNGACVADVDGDGWHDLYLTGIARNRLFRNNRDGTFTDIADEAGVAGSGWSTGCGFADYDNDGELDLFVARYVKMDLEDLPAFGEGKTCQFRGVAVQCGPRGLPGTSDLLYRNNGDGTFSEVSEAAGVNDPDGLFGLGIAWFDHDDDGWLDLFVANDANPNFFYRNLGDGTFEELAFPMGVAVSEDGSEQGCMGVALGDYRNEGRLSLFVTNFAEEYNALYHNEDGYFQDVSFRSATAPSSLPFVGWGTAFFDYDNDGLQDLILVNGHVYPQLENAKLGASAAYRQEKLLYSNQGGGTFREVSAQVAPLLTEKRVSRGLVKGDLDNDGGLDVVVNDLDGHAQLLRNQLAKAGNWLTISLHGGGKNTSAVGALVTLTAAGGKQSQLVRSGTGYISQDDLRLHFGLGDAAKAELLEIRWPDGSLSRLRDLPAGNVFRVSQPAANR